MKQLKKQELLEIKGGINITGTLISSFVKGIEVVLDLGRSLGSALRRSNDNNLCPLTR